MEYRVACDCGKIIPVSDFMAGSSTCCGCGRTVQVPSLSVLRSQTIPDAVPSPGGSPGEAITDAAPPPVPDFRFPDELEFRVSPLAELLAPTQVALRARRGAVLGSPEKVMLALTEDAIWIQKVWQLRMVPLTALDGIAAGRSGAELTLAFRPEISDEKLVLEFASAAVGERWCREVQTRQQQPSPDAPRGERHSPEGVALVRRAPEVAHVVVGHVEFTGQTAWEADRGLQLRAGMLGADAIIGVYRQKCPEVGWGARHASGLAFRVEDADARNKLRLWWYSEEVCALVNRMLLLLVIQAALIFLIAGLSPNASNFQMPTGETRSQALAWAAIGAALVCAWPLVVLALLRVLRWPQLLRTAALAVMAVTTARMLAVWVAHILAARAAGTGTAGSKLWILFDPGDWAFVIIGAVLGVRAWRLAGAARQILPQDVITASTARKVWARGLLAVTGVYALAFLALVGVTRYLDSAHLLQPGVDPGREHQALLAFNQGLAQADKGDLGAAEQSWLRSLRLWEELTAGRSSPSVYRANLALTLNNLGWLRQGQGRADEAEQYYARAVALADQLAGDPQLDDPYKQTMADARVALAGLRGNKLTRLLDEKDRAAVRKYEEAQVKAEQEAATAAELYQEAIALWEEVFPQATSADYRKVVTANLASAYLLLGELHVRLGRRARAEAALRKALDYGEQSVALEPDRPLPRHNLEVARQKLAGLGQRAFQEEINKLCAAERFADAIDLCVRGIKEQEAQVASGKDHDAAVRGLAYRLDRFAWLAAHCPDWRVRDTKAAVKQALRATELQPKVGGYWYTLATVQYRNGDWRDSLTSLETLKAREGAFIASDWLLVAMNRHQLKQRAEAQTALRKAVEWIEERQRQAEGNPVLRVQYEMMRPGLEALRREAENLIAGKDPRGDKLG